MLSTYRTGFQMGIASRDFNLHFIFFFMIYQFIAFRNDNKQENAKKQHPYDSYLVEFKSTRLSH